jgi:hypothetical protein
MPLHPAQQIDGGFMCSPQLTWLRDHQRPPIFIYNLQPDNTCVNPARVRFLLEEKGASVYDRVKKLAELPAKQLVFV